MLIETFEYELPSYLPFRDPTLNEPFRPLEYFQYEFQGEDPERRGPKLEDMSDDGYGGSIPEAAYLIDASSKEFEVGEKVLLGSRRGIGWIEPGGWARASRNLRSFCLDDLARYEL